MKKKRIEALFGRRGLNLIMRKMKLTVLFSFLLFLSSWGTTLLSQTTKLSIHLKNVPVQELIQQIEDLTEFYFLYQDDVFQKEQKVTVQTKEASIESILQQMAEQASIQYRIIDRQVVLLPLGETKLPSGLKSQVQSFQQQKKELTGVVKDKDGNLLPGVSVVVKGTTTGSISDANGQFILTVPDNAKTLVFSFVGMRSQEIEIGKQLVFNVILNEENFGVDEVVVVGFGSQKRENLSGSVSMIKMDEVLADRPIASTANAIQGTLPGLQVIAGTGRPGTGMDLQIRGFESISGGGPLVLVNNVPMSMDNINPRDIETVTILKDASASSIYGARAAFGVILITTKKGVKNQELKVDYSASMSFDYPTELPVKASVYDFVNAMNTWGTVGYWTDQDIPTWKATLDDYKLNPGNYPNGVATINGKNYPLVGNDEAGKEFYGDQGTTQIHNLSITGGSEKSAYHMSLGYTYQDGIIITDNDSYKRYTLNTDYKTDITEKLSVSLNLNYLNSLKKDPVGDYYRYITFAPYTPTGLHTFADGYQVPYNTPGNKEKYSIAPETQRDNLRFFTKTEYEPIKALTFVAEYTFGYSTFGSKYVDNQMTYVDAQKYSLLAGTPESTSLDLSNGETRYSGTNIYAKFKQSFSNHNFEILGGYNSEISKSKSLGAGVNSLIDPSLPALDLATGTEYAGDSYNDWAVTGLFSRLSYNYSQKYFMEINGRRDGSSRFPKDQRYGFFPSASAAWNITKEPFMKDIEQLSLLKLRVSLGEIGNQEIGNYGFYAGLVGTQALWIDPTTGIRVTTLGTPPLVRNNFTWERVRTLNFGLDLGLFNNRLTSSVDAFKRETIDMIAPGAELPVVLGTGAPVQNVADLKTLGWEFEAKWKDKIKDFSYSIGFNLYDNQTEITKFDNKEGLLSQNYIGRKTGEIWGYVTDGYYTVDDFVDGSLNVDLENGTIKEGIVKVQGVNPNPGDIKYKDLNGDGIINSGNSTLYTQYNEDGTMIPNTGPGDVKIIGNSTRRFQYGITAGASWKGFDLSVFIQGIGKRDVWISNDVMFPYNHEFAIMFAHQLDYWTLENTDAYYPRNYARGAGNYGYSKRVQTKYLADGSYVRLKNITLGYNIPGKVFKGTFIKNARAYFSGENLINLDQLPDGLNAELDNLGQGGNYPFLKQYSFGLSVTF